MNPDETNEVEQALARLLDDEPETEDGQVLSEAMEKDPRLRERIVGLLIVDDLLRQSSEPDGQAFLDALQIPLDETANDSASFLQQVKQDLVVSEDGAPSKSKWIARALTGMRASVAIFLTLGPTIGIPVSSYSFSDYGLALPGWTESAHTAAWYAAGVMTALLAVCWLGAWRAGGVRLPWLCGLGAVAMILAVVATHLTLASTTEAELLRRSELIQNHLWVSYDSVFYSPDDLVDVIGQAGQEPTNAQIRKELNTLRRAGFSGLYVHECRTGQLDVPRLAREAGFTAIIQGIRVQDPKHLDAPHTQRQIENAIAVAGYVDAYALGELSAREVDFKKLRAELARLRWKTGKPVTTSFLHADYVGKRGDPLRELEDFTVRALARPWIGNSSKPENAAKAVQDAVRTFVDDDKPGLLTTVFYPAGGGEGFSEEDQFLFFQQVRNLHLPRGVNIIYFNSFDRPWAKKLSEMKKAPLFEGYTGLFHARFVNDGKDAEFTARKAVRLFKAD